MAKEKEMEMAEVLGKEEIVLEECSMGGLLETALEFIPEERREEFLDACIMRGDA